MSCSNLGEGCWWKIYVDEQPVCWWKTFTIMQLFERIDVDEKYVGVWAWNCMLVVLTNIHLNYCLHQHTASQHSENSSQTYFINIFHQHNYTISLWQTNLTKHLSKFVHFSFYTLANWSQTWSTDLIHQVAIHLE